MDVRTNNAIQSLSGQRLLANSNVFDLSRALNDRPNNERPEDSLSQWHEAFCLSAGFGSH